MNWDTFQRSLAEGTRPAELSAPLEALWQDGHGDWQAAHACIQDSHDQDSAWVHAYLHRKEGDLSNAGYWYRRAGQPVFTGSLEEEWQQIVQTLLGRD